MTPFPRPGKKPHRSATIREFGAVAALAAAFLVADASGWITAPESVTGAAVALLAAAVWAIKRRLDTVEPIERR